MNCRKARVSAFILPLDNSSKTRYNVFGGFFYHAFFLAAFPIFTLHYREMGKEKDVSQMQNASEKSLNFCCKQICARRVLFNFVPLRVKPYRLGSCTVAVQASISVKP
jgi:hypothetical protein